MKELVKKIEDSLRSKERVLLAIAGPPAAGKSTISKQLSSHFHSTVVVPLDGFHLDNQILDAKNLRDRKGAAETFDARGFLQIAHQIANKEHVFAPEFDRELDLSRANAIEIKDQRLIIFEGNYLLFNQPPWQNLAALWDISVWLDISLETVEERCIQRWIDHGFSYDDAQKRARSNDVKNAHEIISHKMNEDFIF